MMEKCKHAWGFNLIPGEILKTKFPGVWKCINCGFYLNFNPEKYPDGIAYTEIPQGDKELLEFKTSKY